MYYKLNCEDGTYVGMTSNLERRLHNHRIGACNHRYISYEIMVVTQTKELALRFEDIAIRKYGTLNKQFSGGKSETVEYRFKAKAYYYDNIDSRLAYQKVHGAALREGEMFGRTKRDLYRRMFKEGRV